MKDPQLLPAILPGVFAISNSLSPNQFASTVLPSLKPLFVIKEPPQNMLTLLENLELLQGKTEKPVFKERAFCLLFCNCLCDETDDTTQMYYHSCIMRLSRNMRSCRSEH